MPTAKKPRVIVITGPTASGKSGIAMRLAKRLDGEIVSADSMQVYRGLDIGTAKATVEDREAVVHHLLDIVDPSERFTLAAYLDAARASLRDIIARGKQAIVCGGTGLYIKALVENLQLNEEEEDLTLRHSLQARIEAEGRQALYDELYRLDPVAAKATHPNNEVRVIRALEIIYQTGKTASSYREEAAQAASDNEFRFSVYLPSFEREALYNRINLRVNQMLEDGILDEAKALMELQLPDGATAMQAIGYKELFPYLRGEETLEDASERLKMASRRYAKRQLTWYRPIAWVQEVPAANLFEQVLDDLGFVESDKNHELGR